MEEVKEETGVAEVMSREEALSYNGITVEESGEPAEYEYATGRRNRVVFAKSGGSFKVGLVTALVVAAVCLLLLFVFLPLGLLALAVGLVYYLFRKFWG